MAFEGVADAAVCPFEVERPVMVHHWDTLTFLHWSFEPPLVQRLLPAHLTVETCEERAWVGLVPFFMRVGTRHDRQIAWASRFCETNVRTYVRDEQGRSGIWFMSLDAARLGAVVVARTTYRLPYFWSRMQLAQHHSTVEYLCERRWPGPRGAVSHATVDIGTRFEPDELTDRDHFLTARWRLFNARGGSARAEHAPWVLHRAIARDVHDELLAAAGLPAPIGESSEAPVVHYSPGVTVKIGRPE
jgi:uncharacterized protein YqjF (DUF2071 family)